MRRIKFIVDAHLPAALVSIFGEHDVMHTTTSREGNKTPDAAINELSIKAERVFIIEDNDFIILPVKSTTTDRKLA